MKAIIVDLPNLTAKENVNYSKKVNKYYFACGCSTGTSFMIGAIIIALSLYLFNLIFIEMGIVKWIIYSVIFIIISAVIGKLVGLLIAKIRLRLLVTEMKKINLIWGVLFLLLFATSCKKINQKVTVAKHCSTALIYNGKRYVVCNPEMISAYDNGEQITVTFKKVRKCETYPAYQCMFPEYKEQNIEILEVK